MNSAARERVEGRSHPFSFRPFSSSAAGFLATRAPKALGAFHDKDTARRKADGERGAGIKGRKKEHENQFSPRLPLRSFMRNCTGLRNRKKHKSSRVTRLTRSFSRLMIPFCLPSLVSSNAYAYFLRALDIVASFYVYIYIHVVYTRTFLLFHRDFRTDSGENRAPIETNYSRRICRS